MSDAPALSSGAMLEMRRSSGSPSRNLARVSAAISPVVKFAIWFDEIGHVAVRGENYSRDQKCAPPPKAKNWVRS